MRQHRQLKEVLRWQLQELLVMLTFAVRAAAKLVGADQAATRMPPAPTSDCEEEPTPLGEVTARLVDRVLSALQEAHMQEIADRRRGDSVEMRLAITTHCQMETGAVQALLGRDLEAFTVDLRAGLASECEQHLVRERAGLMEEVEDAVARRVEAYRQEVAAEEQQAVMERRKALAGKLAGLERQGLLRPETKAVYER